MTEKWLLCVDPDSSQIYTLNISTSEVHVEKDAPQFIRDSVEKTINDILSLVQLNDASWLCESKNSQKYRRRKIPSYLLHKISCEYPTYVCQSTLSLAFAEVNSIKLSVNLSEYKEAFMKYDSHDEIKKIEIEAGLVTGADEVIKNILRKIHMDHQIKLKPKDDKKKFILKIFGFREYLTGNHAMLSYDRIRINLRGIRSLEVILTEILKSQDINEMFPPIVERDPKESKNNDFKAIDWEKFQNVPMFLWYPPDQLPKFSLHNSVDNSQIRKDKEQLKMTELNSKPKTFFSLKEPETNRPRVVSKTVMKDFHNLRTTQHENNVIFLEHNVLYSGECDWPFRIRICGIENLFKIFEQADDADIEHHPEQCAVYNGLIPPRYVTRVIKCTETADVAKKPKKKDKDKAPKEKAKYRSLTPKLIRTKERESTHTNADKTLGTGKKIFTRYTSHGANGTNFFAALAKRYGMEFTPYLVQAKVSLYFGCNLLRPNCISTSRMVPFSNSPKWFEWIEFKDLKISQLPQELRACIDIVAYSASGESKVIAHESFELFDCVGKYKSGLNGANLWPFYQTEPRLSCMNEYWGLRGVTEIELPLEKSKKSFICQNFARLYVQLESFVFPMYWSLRDDKLMQSLGFPTLRLIEEDEDSDKEENKLIKTLQKTKNILTGNKQDVHVKKIVEKLDWNDPPKTDDLARLQNLLNTDPLNRDKFTDEEKFILIKCRHHYKTLPNALPIFLVAIDWSDPSQVSEAHHMLKVWTPLPPEEALPLLDANFPDEAVRLYAVERISTLSDDELELYMLELSQALMFESQHFSALGEFLLERSLANPFVVGHELFWQLRSQLHVKPSFERYALILEQLLMLCGGYRKELFMEVRVNDGMMNIAESIKLIQDKEKRKDDLQKKLMNYKQTYQVAEHFGLAVDSRMECNECNREHCKVLNSKKLPLLLNLQNSQNEAPPIIIIYKTGDDLRQDILTIQLIKIMDKIWLDDGYDLRMKPYKVVATKDQVGMIEFVQNSETTESIQTKYGGKYLGALKQDTILSFLEENNKKENYLETAKENFLRSCAGYCVATYVLGIGDRHSGNIMLTKTGHLFHIDFGHFLGNYKMKFGIKRERDPFVFTPEMAYVLGGRDHPNFKTFEEYCTKAYNLVRKHGYFLISIFMMMLSAGMPELSDLSDIEYLKMRLSLNLSEQEATNKFKREIYDSLNTTFRKFDNLLHNIKRGK